MPFPPPPTPPPPSGLPAQGMDAIGVNATAFHFTGVEKPSGVDMMLQKVSLLMFEKGTSCKMDVALCQFVPVA